MKPNAINYLSLARKAGRIEAGEEPTGAAARAQHARLVILAADAPAPTVRRARSFVAGSGQQLVTVPFTKEELGRALGRSVVSMAAITDPALALAFLQALEAPQRYAAAMEDLTNRTNRVRQHQKEEKAHQRNLQQGKKKHQPPAPAPAADGKTDRKPGKPQAEKPASKPRSQGRPQGQPMGPKAGPRRQDKPAAPRKATGNRPAAPKAGRKTYGGAKS